VGSEFIFYLNAMFSSSSHKQTFYAI